ncbi:MAG: DNA polymerase III subunit chi [Betaproteobacteria bacterium]|nr:DNA polymerase III subunit chi [Betaproteobacteria bacterium]
MTRIDFYTHVADKLPVAVQLIGKAWERGLSVWVRTADENLATRLDETLWLQPAGGFVPHCRASHALAAETPVIIDSDGHEPRSHQVLVNLGHDRPDYFSRFERLIEIVSLDEADRQRARERFLFYRDRGFELHSHNLSQTS